MADSRRLLIIEDDHDTAGLMSYVAERAGHRPILTWSGKEGLRLLEEGGADLILLDLMLLDLDGWSVLETIRADERFRTVPVIIVSARHPAEQVRAIEAHAGMFDSYIGKPFAVEQLASEIETVLSHRAGREEQ